MISFDAAVNADDFILKVTDDVIELVVNLFTSQLRSVFTTKGGGGLGFLEFSCWGVVYDVDYFTIGWSNGGRHGGRQAGRVGRRVGGCVYGCVRGCRRGRRDGWGAVVVFVGAGSSTL